MRRLAWGVFLLAMATATFTADYTAMELMSLLHDPEQHISLRPRKTTTDWIAAHEYVTETHKVIADDGYVLTLFRIPYSHKLQNQETRRPIVLIQHGMGGSSDSWVLNGPNDGLPYLLSDAGFDVWLGNARGTTYGRNHTTLSTKHPYFWRFSWHEIGVLDLPAMIDYALATNGAGQQAIHYVGHSQGTTAFFVLLSSRPEYNARIKTAHMLAPVVFMSNATDALLNTFAPILGHHNTYAQLFGGQEFLPYNELYLLLAYNACNKDLIHLGLCSSIAFWMQGKNSNTNVTATIYVGQSHPAGISTDQIRHYMQEHQSRRFCRFDYGPRKNVQLYGQVSPPDYPLELATAELHLWYSDNDQEAAVVDVEELATRLPNRVMHHIADPTWAHGDFSMALEVRKYINDPIIAIMSAYEAEHSY